MENDFQDFLNKYDSYPTNIQRVDSFRYFLLKKIGGVYVDMDFECLENIEALLRGYSCVIGKEPKSHCDRFSVEMILCNAFMAAAPNDAFISFVCQKVAGYRDTVVKSL